MFRERRLSVGTVDLNCAIAAEAGPPLLLLHGVTGRWQTWLSVMPSLALRWQLYALDLRGHGASGHKSAAYRINDYADDVAAVLQREIGAPTVLVGHSLGAIIATAVAARVPDRVRAVVLEDPPLAAFRHERLRERPEHAGFVALRDLASEKRTPDDLLTILSARRPELDRAGVRAWATAIGALDPDVLTMIVEDRAKAGYDQDDCLRRIGAPTLLLQGEPSLGGALADEDARRAVGLLVGGTYVKLPHVGHGIHTADPAGFCRIVHDFLETL
ncbi:MAG TPA: alpha/beta hydrolase [Thermomicrobiales bacterium]